MPLIVILDDRATNRKIFSKLAASIESGVTVRSFGDPPELLAWLEHNTPDLIVTDFKMPTMDGAEFIRRFRAQPNSGEIPVIVITIYEEREFRLRALEAGATDFLNSPVDHQEFVTRARNLLKLRKQQIQLASPRRQPRAGTQGLRALARRGAARFERTARAGHRYRSGDDQRYRPRRAHPVHQRVSGRAFRHRSERSDRTRYAAGVRRGPRHAQ